MNIIDQNKILNEHRFWLQILGDHSRFILNALPSSEPDLIQKSKYFISLFDKLLDTARKEPSSNIINELTMEANKAALELKEFKLYILSKQITNKISINQPPTFLNHMINELNEYLRILNCYINKQPYSPTPIHHHLLWLTDGAGHAEAIGAFLDMSEKEDIKISQKYAKTFNNLYLKAIEFNGYTRTGITDFPALERLNNNANTEMESFKQLLEELKLQITEKKILGVLKPLTPDHMYREECYYQTKLSEVSKIKKPNCDPARPRPAD